MNRAHPTVRCELRSGATAINHRFREQHWMSQCAADFDQTIWRTLPKPDFCAGSDDLVRTARIQLENRGVPAQPEMLARAVAAGLPTRGAEDAIYLVIAAGACRGDPGCRAVLMKQLSHLFAVDVLASWMVTRAAMRPGKIDLARRLKWRRRPRRPS